MLYLKMESSRLFCPFLHSLFRDISNIADWIKFGVVSGSFAFLRQGCFFQILLWRLICIGTVGGKWMVPPDTKEKFILTTIMIISLMECYTAKSIAGNYVFFPMVSNFSLNIVRKKVWSFLIVFPTSLTVNLKPVLCIWFFESKYS